MSNWIDLDHPVILVMDFNEFHNFFFYKLFLFNFMIKLYARKIKHQPLKQRLFLSACHSSIPLRMQFCNFEGSN